MQAGILPHYRNAIGRFGQIRVYQSQHPQVHRLGNTQEIPITRRIACSIIPLIACQLPSMRRRAEISAQIFERSTHSIASVLRVKGGMNLPAKIHTHQLGNHSSSGQSQRSRMDARIGTAEFPCVHPRLQRRRRRSVYKHRHAYKY